jgi:hypothetical protein
MGVAPIGDKVAGRPEDGAAGPDQEADPEGPLMGRLERDEGRDQNERHADHPGGKALGRHE